MWDLQAVSSLGSGWLAWPGVSSLQSGSRLAGLARGVPPSLIPCPLRVNSKHLRDGVSQHPKREETDWLDLTRVGAEMNRIEIQICCSECSQQVLQSHLINLLREILETYLMPDKQSRDAAML